MPNIVEFNPAQTPSFARTGELSPIAKSLTGGSTGDSIKRISIKGGVFRLVAGGKEVASIDDRHLDVVVVNAAPKISRTFYAGQFVEGEAKGPDCWSADGDKPDASIKEPQNSTCVGCPQNIKGSGQGDSRACRFSQRLAVVLANDTQGGDVMQLTLAATSIFGKELGDDKRPLQAYARYLAAQNISPEMVVTRMRFDTKAAVPKLFFMPVRWLSDDEYQASLEKGQSEDAKRAVTMSVAQTDSVAVPTQAIKLAGTKPVSQPVAELVEDEDEVAVAEEVSVDEPEKRKANVKPSAVPKKGSSLSSIVDDWDADDE